MKQVTKQQQTSDDLAGAIAGAMRGMHQLREENSALRAWNTELEHRRSVLELEVANLKSQLDNERNERRHYHSLANEIITRLDVVGRTVDDVVQRAQHEVYSLRKEQPLAELPELTIPAFLKKPMTADAGAEPKPEAKGPSEGHKAAAFPKIA